MIRHKLDPETKTISLELPDRVVSTNANDLLEYFEQIQNQFQWDHIEIDMKMTRFIDSVGLNFIVHVIRENADKKQKPKLKVFHPHIIRSIKSTSLDRHLDMEVSDYSI